MSGGFTSARIERSADTRDQGGPQVSVSVRISALPSHAFDVFTYQIGHWWIANPLLHFVLKSPEDLQFCERGAGLNTHLVCRHSQASETVIGKVSIWEPGKRLVMSWHQATLGIHRDTEIDLRFQRLGSQTRIQLTHSGWSLPKADDEGALAEQDLFLARHGDYWRILFMRMETYITDSSLI